MGAEKLLTQAEAPIRSNFLPDDRMRQLGELLARGGLDTYFGLTGFDFQARMRDDGAKILEVYRSINAAQAKGDIHHAGGAVAARQPLSGRGDDLPGQARPAAQILS